MTTNEEFNEMRSAGGFGVKEAAAMMDANLNTVKSWVKPPGSAGFANMPTYALRCFKLVIQLRSHGISESQPG